MKTLARGRDKAEIVERLAHVRPDSARQWGRMSAHEMVCHLADACRMAMGTKPVTDASGLLQRTVVKWTALYLPMQWPTGRLVTRPEIAPGTGGTRPGHFASDLAELVVLTEQFASCHDTSKWPPHPIFGRLSPRGWMRWGYLHMDHHLRQFGA
jgi:hypothetical protein